MLITSWSPNKIHFYLRGLTQLSNTFWSTDTKSQAQKHNWQPKWRI